MGGGVAGAVGGMMLVGCGGVPRVVSRWPGFSGAKGVLRGHGGQGANVCRWGDRLWGLSPVSWRLALGAAL